MCFQQALKKTLCLMPPPLPINNLSTTSHKIRLSVSASSLPLYRIRLSVSASPSPIGSQQSVPMVAHSAPRFPTSNRSTQGHYKRITTHPQQSANTPAQPFPHPQLPPFCKSQLTHDSPPPSFLHANFMAIRELILPLCKLNQGFSIGSWMS